ACAPATTGRATGAGGADGDAATGRGAEGTAEAAAGGGSDEGRNVLPRLSDDADQSSDGGSVARGDEDFAQNAGPERFHFDISLVGLDLGQDVAALDPVPFFLEPLDDLAALHRVGELGHDDLGDGHGSVPVRVANAANGGGDSVLLRRLQALEVTRVGHGGVGAGHP